jgi:hypothetical protein
VAGANALQAIRAPPCRRSDLAAFALVSRETSQRRPGHAAALVCINRKEMPAGVQERVLRLLVCQPYPVRESFTTKR